MSAESAIVQEHQRAHITSLVSEQIWDNALLAICGNSSTSFYLLFIPSIHLIFVFSMRQLPSLLSMLVTFNSLSPSAQPYNAEFYFDTPNPVRILKGNNYSYNLQWTQKDPEATDRIIGYWVNIRKVKHSYTKYSFHTCTQLVKAHVLMYGSKPINTGTCCIAHMYVHTLSCTGSVIFIWRTGRDIVLQMGTHWHGLSNTHKTDVDQSGSNQDKLCSPAFVCKFCITLTEQVHNVYRQEHTYAQVCM